jgi:hypothetical protein
MANSIINADDGTVSGTSGLKSTGGNDDVLEFQLNGATAMTLESNKDLEVVGSVYFENGKQAVSTGKAIAMAIVFG